KRKNPTPPLTYVKVSPPRRRGGAGGVVLGDFCKRSIAFELVGVGFLPTSTQNYFQKLDIAKESLV
ncbi:hypothetical protein, partial [Nostoc commune]|uniref:hypothetical protein n=1 Tax=Nostoc commune TaxID=1178 RepID=UPI001E416712